MKKIICSKLEIIHCDNVEKIEAEQVIHKEDKNFISIPLEEAAVYSISSKNDNAGVVLNETVTAKTKSNENINFLKNALRYYILRLHTNKGIILVGTLDYPAEKTYTSDINITNLTFKASKPQL